MRKEYSYIQDLIKETVEEYYNSYEHIYGITEDIVLEKENKPTKKEKEIDNDQPF